MRFHYRLISFALAVTAGLAWDIKLLEGMEQAVAKLRAGLTALGLDASEGVLPSYMIKPDVEAGREILNGRISGRGGKDVYLCVLGG